MTTEQRHEQALITLYKISKRSDIPKDVAREIEDSVLFGLDFCDSDARKIIEQGERTA